MHETTPDDQTLLRRYQRGDRSAGDALFARHREPAYRVAYRLLGNEADALDAVQNGFIKAIVNRSRFCGRSSFRTWLLRIVSNAAIDIGRQRRRHDRYIVTTVTGSEPDDANTYEDAVERDLRAEVARALQTLPEAQRRTLALAYDAGLSYREIAEATGTSLGTVMSRLFYARQKLKALFAPDTVS